MRIAYNQSPFIFPVEAGERPPASKPHPTFITVSPENQEEKTSITGRSGQRHSSRQDGQQTSPHRPKGSSCPRKQDDRPECVVRNRQPSSKLPFHPITRRGVSTEKRSTVGEQELSGNPQNTSFGTTGRRTEGGSQPSLSIATLNTKNVKTNLNYLTSLSKSRSILIVQEHWLYAFESSIVQQIYNNRNYHIKCVDDLDPIPPIQPTRGHAGTCILWKKEINHYVNILPDGGHRITAIEFKGDDGLVCLINVYMPAKGSPDCDMQFQSTLDEIHEILEKYGQTHKIILGGDFNAHLHRTPPLGRDLVLQTFLAEHNLYLPDNYPSQYTYFHEGTDAKSQIDYWFISPRDQEKRTR